MNLQTRKLEAISYLISLQDEKSFLKIENAIKETQNNPIKKLTKQEILNRAKISNQDYLNGNFKSQDELELESKKW